MKIGKLFSVVVIFGFLTAAASTLAATGDYVPLVKIPGVDPGNFLNYLRDMYNFLISIVGILAMASLVYGGFRYLTSVGNPAAVEDAKDIINSAIVGLVLALSSWLILNEINPDVLVTSRKPGGGMDALKGLKYAYNETSFAKCFTNVDDPGYGTQAHPCTCLDGTEQYTTKPKTNLTLNVAPPSISIGGSVTASGKLTNATTGAGIAGKSIGIIISNSAVKGSGLIPSTGELLSWLGLGTTITTGPDGNFSVPLGPSKCVATEQWQAVFQGDTTYFPAGSSILSITTNPPGTSCTQGDYPVKSVASFMSSNTCQNLCSDTTGNVAADGKFHCVSEKVGVGITAEQAASGNQTLSIKYSTPVFVDVVSNIKSPFGIGKVEFYHHFGLLTWTGVNSTICILNPACGTKGCSTSFGEKDVSPPEVGKFITSYAGGTYNAGADIYVINPATGKCDTFPTIKDRGITIEVIP